MLLALFLGGIGIHRFYIGQLLKGFLSIIFSWTLIPFLIGIIDFFRFMFMNQDYFDIQYNNKTNLICSVCNKTLFKDNTSFWGLGIGKPSCKSCFQKVRVHSKKSGKYEFDEKEIENIIKDRPLPKNIDLKPIIPSNEHIETYQLPEDIDALYLNILAFIYYTDAQNQNSSRRITIKSIYKTNNDYMLEAYCHEREAHRSFKLSRINKLAEIL